MRAKVPQQAQRGRIHSLDGLRGLAALTVVLYHDVLAFSPFAWSGFTLGRLSVFGDLPVCVFFVLSGFVLSESAIRRRTGLPATLLARYLRLTVPMTASLLLACGWLVLFRSSRLALQATNINPWLSTAFVTNQPVSVPQAMGDGLVGVYLTGSSLYNCVVWTMKIELVGSFLIYLLYRFLPARWRWLGLAGIGALAWHNPFYLGFALGVGLRELRAAGWLREGFRAIVAATTSVALAALPLVRGPAEFAVLSVAAGLLVLSVLTWRRLQRVLESTPAQFLGRISFSLYLVHAPLLVTLMAWYQLRMAEAPALGFGTGLIGFTAVSVALAWLMTITVDEPLVRTLHRQTKRQAA